MTGMGASASTLDVIGREAHAVDRSDVLSAWAIVKSEEPLLGWKKKCIDSLTKVEMVPTILFQS